MAMNTWHRLLLALLIGLFFVHLAEEDLNSKNEKTFFETGCFPITKSMEHQLFLSEKNCTFIPNFTVVKNHLENEGNIYIWAVDDIQRFNFRLYGEKHPDYFNYKFNVHANETLRCFNTSDCEEMDTCYLGIIDVYPDQLSKNVVFVTWKMRRKHITILFQYQNLVVKCEDFETPEPISKLVLEGSVKQRVKTKINVVYAYSVQPKSENYLVPPKTTSVSVQISFCLKCEVRISFVCSNETVSTHLRPGNLFNVIFYNSIVTPSWREIVLNNPVGDRYNCSLDVNLVLPQSSYNDVDFFWKIALLEFWNESKTSELLPAKKCNVSNISTLFCKEITDELEIYKKKLTICASKCETFTTKTNLCLTAPTSPLPNTTSTNDECTCESCTSLDLLYVGVILTEAVIILGLFITLLIRKKYRRLKTEKEPRETELVSISLHSRSSSDPQEELDLK